MNDDKYKKCTDYISNYLASQTEDSISVKIDDNVRYLMCQQYVEGYNDGMHNILNKLNKTVDNHTDDTSNNEIDNP